MVPLRFRLFSFFWPFTKSSQIGPLSNPSKISKIGPLSAQSQILKPFWMTFGITFSIIFPDRLHLVICNKHNAIFYFCNFRPLILASKIDKTIMVFQSRFLDLPFLIVFQIYFKNDRFRDTLQDPMGAKKVPKLHLFNINHVFFQDAKTAVFQTLFSRNHTN